MEPYLRQPCPFQYPVEHMQDAVRGHGAAGGGREHILAEIAVLLFLFSQNAYRIGTNADVAVGVFRFQWSHLHLAVDPAHLPPDMDDTIIKVNVLPFQPQQFTPSEAGRRMRSLDAETALLVKKLRDKNQGAVNTM